MGRLDHLTLQWFDLSIRNTAIRKKYFSTGPSMLNVPNKALICDPIQCQWWEWKFNHSAGLVLLKFGIEIPGYRLLGTAKHTQCRLDRPHVYIHSVDF